MPERIAHLFEFAVGIMLLLGADLLRRLIVARVHFHMHRHVDGTTHLHAHSHAGEADHAGSRNDHVHARGLPLRALTVGLMHGLAGSAALILLTAGQIDSLLWALAYPLGHCFSRGSSALERTAPHQPPSPRGRLASAATSSL